MHTSNKEENSVMGFIILLVGGICLLSGGGIKSCMFKYEAIEKGFAEHDKITGEWKWKEGPNGNK